jgi:oligosaccharide repeat unit polymerase
MNSFFEESEIKNKHRSIYLIVLIVYLLLAAGLFSLPGAWETVTGIYIIFCLFICVGHLIYKRVNVRINIFSPDILYIGFFMIFHFGYLVLWVFKVVPSSDFIFNYVNLFPKTMLIATIGLISFILGYEFIRVKSIGYHCQMQAGTGWSTIGMVIMITGLGIHIVYIMAAGFDNFIRHGYEVFMNMDRYVTYARLWQFQPQIFALGFTIYIVSKAINYRKLSSAKMGIVLFLIQAFLLATEGARSSLITLGIILVLARHYCIKRFNLLQVGVLAVSLLFVFWAIGLVRNIASFDIARTLQEVKYARESGEANWYNPFVEMGGSIRTVNLTVSLVPESQPYWFGRSYLQATVKIIPYLQGLTKNYLGLTPAQWLTFTLFGYDAAGTGFSIAGEGYLNFGIPGVFLQMFMIGMLLKYIYIRFLTTGSPSNALLFFASLGIFLIAVRNHSNLMVAPLIQVALLSWGMKKVFGEYQVMTDEPYGNDVVLESGCEDDYAQR